MGKWPGTAWQRGAAWVAVAMVLFGSMGAAVAKGGTGSGAKPVAGAVQGRQHDSQGRYTGRIDADGRRYDSQGRYLGRVDADGRQFDSQGRTVGRTDVTGRQFDAQGRNIGSTDAQGRIYDAQGRYQGRVDADGRRYDEQGRYVGRLDADGQAANAARRAESMPSRPQANANAVESTERLSPVQVCRYGVDACAQ